MAQIKWPPVIARAAEIVESYSIPVTLRQTFYKLLMEGLIPNSDYAYKKLSAETADRRRAGEFPPLFDRGRGVLQPTSWESPKEGVQALATQYRVDREGDRSEASSWTTEGAPAPEPGPVGGGRAGVGGAAGGEPAGGGPLVGGAGGPGRPRRAGGRGRAHPER